MKSIQQILQFALCSVAILTAAFTAPAQAKDDGTDTSWTQEKLAQHFKVAADGTYVMTGDVTARINEERAVASMAQQSLEYNQSREKIEILSAYTLKADGRKVMVTPDKIKDQQENQSAGAPMFQDMHVKVLIFPDVEVGDRIVYKYRLICSIALYPGQFEDTTSAAFVRNQEFSMFYDLPKGMRLYADNRGFKEIPGADDGGRHVYRWDYIPGDNPRIENNTVAYTDYGSRLYVSTFRDYRTMAQAYDARAVDKIVAAPRVTALALDLTKGLTDPRPKAYAIADWVRKNIRYVAVYIGAGGVVPHPADTILDNLYGDCKDHTTLVEAMLKTVGIESTPALINFGNAYRLSNAPVTFNHVINYIPSLDLYLDTTARDVAPGFLPQLDLDKQVLLTHSGAIGHTPSEQETAQTAVTEIHISSDESAEFTQVETFSGLLADTNFFALRNFTQSDLDERVRRILSQRGQLGSGKLEYKMLDVPANTLQITMKGRNESFVDMPGPIGVALTSSISNDIAGAFAGMSSEAVRTQDFVCLSHSYDDEARYIVGDDIEILAIPASISAHDAYIDYQSHYDRKDQVVTVKRHLVFSHAGAVCTPQDYLSMSPMINKLARDFRAQFILRKRVS
jgi:transglutaminase-like putative cysteine protease